MSPGSARAYEWTCPKCGKSDGVTYNVRVNGWREWSWSPQSGTEMNTDDNMRETVPASGVCDSCGKRIPLPPGAG